MTRPSPPPPSPNVPIVRYRFARASDGFPIAIENYLKGTPATCFGCDGSLVAKQGLQKQWHFAHNADVDCSPETALHRLSKSLVQEGHRRARSLGRPYLVSWKCPRCRTGQSFDVANRWTHVEIEAAPIPGVRNDLLFQGARPFAVEIVVTHGPEARTIERCAAEDLSIFVVRPTWDNVEHLLEGIEGAHLVGVRPMKCSNCIEAADRARREKKRAEEMQRRAEEQARELAAELRKAVTLSDKDARRRLERWREQHNIPVHPLREAQIAIDEQAHQLVKLGFIPVDKDGLEFVYDLPRRIGTATARINWNQWPLWNVASTSIAVTLYRPKEELAVVAAPLIPHLRRNRVRVRNDWPTRLVSASPRTGVLNCSSSARLISRGHQ